MAPDLSRRFPAVRLESYIRSVPDFPIPGILFRDITPLLQNAAAFTEATNRMAQGWGPIDVVAATEARGFIFGATVADRLDAGFIPVRKAGRLPWQTESAEYTLEYRSDVLHIHKDAISPGQRVLVVDDLIATGGTAKAVAELVERLGGKLVGFQFLIELAGLKGRELLAGWDVRSVMTLEGE
jgi:adenine phosphoribosyltransferase